MHARASRGRVHWQRGRVDQARTGRRRPRAATPSGGRGARARRRARTGSLGRRPPAAPPPEPPAPAPARIGVRSSPTTTSTRCGARGAHTRSTVVTARPAPAGRPGTRPAAALEGPAPDRRTLGAGEDVAPPRPGSSSTVTSTCARQRPAAKRGATTHHLGAPSAPPRAKATTASAAGARGRERLVGGGAAERLGLPGAGPAPVRCDHHSLARPSAPGRPRRGGVEPGRAGQQPAPVGVVHRAAVVGVDQAAGPTARCPGRGRARPGW